ncbi:MAG: hypothetical protein HY057_14350, partial [Rhodospirillales bacterium]|nr:hypothetical protein [Rhodospirillales bacterium]
MNVRILAIFMMIFMTSPAVWAAQHGHADPSPHGGEMASVGNMHLELVVKPGELRVYVMDHNDKALDAKGGMASAL